MQTNWDRDNNRQVPAPRQDFDLDHEGHSGWRADQLRDGSYTWANTYKPDIVLLHAGTNDLLQNQSIPSTIDDMSQLIDQLRRAKADVKILLAQIIGSTREQGLAPRIATYNQRILELASQKTTSLSPIYVVDQATGFDPETDTYDRLHPNAQGEKKMADKWYTALRDILPPPSPLPVELVRFSAKYEQSNKRVTLEWITASEKNNRFFTVERSKDQLQFESLASVPGAFTTQAQQIYTSYDQSPLIGTGYYRLKQTDVDGKFTYSKVVSVTNLQHVFAVYPNPVHGREITLLLNSNSAGTIVDMYNALGKQVYFNDQLTGNTPELKIHLDDRLEDGIYFIKVRTLSGDFIQKLVIFAN
jgi:hypothetical protein